MIDEEIVARFEEIKHAAKKAVGYQRFDFRCIDEMQAYNFMYTAINEYKRHSISREDANVMLDCAKATFVRNKKIQALRASEYKLWCDKKACSGSISAEIIKFSKTKDFDLVLLRLIDFFGIMQDEVSAKIVRDNLCEFKQGVVSDEERKMD